MILKILIVLTIVYLLIVLRIYSLTLYYRELDGLRKLIFITPLITIHLFFVIYKDKEYNMLRYFIFHIPSAFIAVGFQYCLMSKHVSNNIVQKSNNKIDMRELYNKAEKLICQS